MAIESSAPAQSRRALLAGALGGLAGAVATALGRPGATDAAAGSNLIIGSQTNNAGTSDTQLITSSTVIAFKLLQNGPGTALMGHATPTTGGTRGVYGRSDSPNGFGVQARNAGAQGFGAAIQAFGVNNTGIDVSTDNAVKAAIYADHNGNGNAIFAVSTGGSGVYGASASSPGVQGTSTSQYGVAGSGGSAGVHGASSAEFGAGLHGVGLGTSGHGVVGSITADSGTASGVYGASAGNFSYAGYFEGHVGITGTLENAAGLSKIDHPLDPAGKVLLHASVVSNERLTVYAGTVTTDEAGEAEIWLPGYFSSLNRDLRYQLTVLGSFAQAMVKAEVAGNRFTIATSEPATKVCWQVTGVRQDAYATSHPLAVELDKAGEQRGRYLHPIEHGQPDSSGVDYPMRQRLAALPKQPVPVTARP